VKSFEPISVARDRSPGIAEDNRQNVLLQFDGEFECAAVKALQKAVVRPSSLGKEMNERGVLRDADIFVDGTSRIAGRDAGAPSKDLSATLQGDFRFVGLDEDVAKNFAADAEHRVIEDTFLGSLTDIAGQADDEHDIDRRLVITDDDGGFGESFARNILKFEFAEGHPFDDAAGEATGCTANVIKSIWPTEKFQNRPQDVIEKDLAAAEMEQHPTGPGDMPPARRAARLRTEEQEVHQEGCQNQCRHKSTDHSEENGCAH